MRAKGVLVCYIGIELKACDVGFEGKGKGYNLPTATWVPANKSINHLS